MTAVPALTKKRRDDHISTVFRIFGPIAPFPLLVSLPSLDAPSALIFDRISWLGVADRHAHT